MAFSMDFCRCPICPTIDRPDIVQETLIIRAQERTCNPDQCEILFLGQGLLPLFFCLFGLFKDLPPGFSAKLTKVLKD